MADVLSFEDFKRSKLHKKKMKEFDNVIKTLNNCQKTLMIHKDYLIIQNLMKNIDSYVEKFLKIKETEELHYDYLSNKEKHVEEPEILRD